MKKKIVYQLLLLTLTLTAPLVASAEQSIRGKVLDKKTNEALIGATILVEGTTKATSADIDGNFQLNGLGAGKYNLLVSYVSYQSLKLENVLVKSNEITNLDALMEEAALMLKSVEIVAQRRTDTELSMLKNVRSAVQVVSGISSQQIGKTLDKDASEVVKRVSGVTIQDNRFIVVRGLNQRYNNVWLNNAATPSSETDVKAFSFDAIPSSMIDNLLVFKSGSPEIAAEATGGFIKISTKNIPDENFLNVEYGVGYNDQTTLKDTYQLPSKPLDFLGLGSNARGLPSDIPANLSLPTGSLIERDQSALKLSNQWVSQPHTALPNQKASIAFGKKWVLEGGQKVGTITSFNYGNNYSTRSNMANNTYERFDPTNESPTYSFKYNANLYSNEYKVGLMHNWAFQNTKGSKIEFKNIFNQTGVDKSTVTEGWNSNRQGNFRYYSNQYSSRTYSGQLSGDHFLNEEIGSKIDWNLGFAYANRIEPDRQNWSMKQNADGKYEYMLPTVPSINELGRLYMSNHEFVNTAATNYEQKLKLGTIESTLKAGEYTEYKTRNLSERSICYRNTNSGFLSDNDINALPFNDLFTAENLGNNKVMVVSEETNKANSYNASNLLTAGYLALNLPIQRFNVYGGVRTEYNSRSINGYRNAVTPIDTVTTSLHFFPSFNASYKLSQNGLVRIAYARTINRPEFREVSSTSYYDFNEKFAVTGNPKLKDALIQNFDVRFETYPTPNETFSAALFYKRFANPIEMVSVGSGANFSFQNAVGATNLGVELEMKKSLETLLGLRNFSLSVNASYIYSNVEFADRESERSRPLQGQSPMVVNAALFYQNDKAGWSSSLMYNVMGKRILVAAQLNQGEVVTPDIYEMPRHVIDFSLNKKIGKQLELKLGIKDILAMNFVTQQTFEYVKEGVSKSVDLNNKSYNLGRSITLGGTWRF